MSRFDAVSLRKLSCVFLMTSSRGALFAFRHQTNDYSHRLKTFEDDVSRLLNVSLHPHRFAGRMIFPTVIAFILTAFNAYWAP